MRINQDRGFKMINLIGNVDDKTICPDTKALGVLETYNNFSTNVFLIFFFDFYFADPGLRSWQKQELLFA